MYRRPCQDLSQRRRMGIAVFVGVVAALMFIVETLQPGREFPKVAGWWGRALLLNGVQVASVLVAGMTWDRWMPGRSLWSLSGFSTAVQAVIGYLVITFIYYWWHRFRHDSSFLWRWFHQVHHSPQRLEIITSFYKHPIEIFANSILSSAIMFMLCGLTVEAAGLAVLATGLAELFYHWNVRTPYWLGFVFQRPESHCVHHQMHKHHRNYADLPLWDMLFGTFHNPRVWEAECGFVENRELELGAMLAGRDVNSSPQGEGGGQSR